MKAPLALLIALSSAATRETTSHSIERRFHDSLAAYRRGEHQTALEGFMGVVLEDPSYPGARERLAQAARRILEAEAAAADSERARLLREIKGLAAASAAPRGRSAREALDLALHQAQTPRLLRQALDSYRRAIEAVPVRHRDARAAETRTLMQRALLQSHPKLAASPAWRERPAGSFETASLAAALLADSGWEAQAGLLVAAPAAPPAEDAALLRSLHRAERLKLELEAAAASAHREFRESRFEAAAALWRRVLAADPANPEALFYLQEIAAARAGSKRLRPGADPAFPRR